jgi:mitogen-activated protein kinase kinase kinase ANP1
MLNIFLEYVPGGSIYSLLKKFGSFPEDVIRTYTKRILVGLEYLHAHNIIHRGPSIAVDTAAGVALWYSSSWFGVCCCCCSDIKGANILVDHNGRIKLTDFGASKRIEGLNKTKGHGSLRGTIFWMAPEVVRQEEHGRYVSGLQC